MLMTVSLFRRLKAGRRAEVFREMRERAHHGVGGETPERAERAELHRVAEVFEHGEIFRNALAAHDLVDRLDAARGTDAAGCALAAALDRAELHREACLLRHVG